MSEAEHKLDLITARNSQAVGSSTTNSSTITIPTVTLAKEINTTLGGLIVLLTIGSYWLLMRYTPTLSNEIILPSKLLDDNIATVLSLTWPKHFGGSLKESIPPNEFRYGSVDHLVLVCKKWTNKVESYHKQRLWHQLLGFDDLKGKSNILQMGKSYMVKVRAFSPIMKNLVQIAMWNYISLWLVLVMIVDTLVYNGFLSHGINNDSVLRLLLVSVYAVATIGHRYHTTTLLYRNFTYVIFQTCWTIICKEFIFGDRVKYELQVVDRPTDSSDIVWTSLDFELFGTMEHLGIYQDLTMESGSVGFYNESDVFSEWSKDDERRWSHARRLDKTGSKADTFAKPILEAETKACERATESALEKTLANVAVLLGICLATALAPWNSTQTISATSAQLGSYALLLSISAGFLALMSSMTQLMNATESARILLLLQEKTIAAHEFNQEDGDVSKKYSLRDEPDFSLSKDIKGKSQLTSCSLWRSMSLFDKLRCLLLGPALMLIPRMHGARLGHPDQGSDFLSITVQGVQFTCGTIGSKLGEMSRLVPPSSNKETGQ